MDNLCTTARFLWVTAALLWTTRNFLPVRPKNLENPLVSDLARGVELTYALLRESGNETQIRVRVGTSVQTPAGEAAGG